MMFSVLLLQRLWKSPWTEGRETLMTLSAPLTIICRAFLSDILQLEYHVEIRKLDDLAPLMSGCTVVLAVSTTMD